MQMLNVSHNYLTEESFRPDVFADIRTLETLDLQRNRSVSRRSTQTLGLHHFRQ